MEIFLISFMVFLLTAFAIGIGIMFRGRTMHVGCRGLPDGSNCKSKAQCDGACRRVR